MYANVEIKIRLGQKLTVPEGAVIDTGIRQMVIVDKGSGYFEPREVKVGAKVEDYYEVTQGLKAGERVVTSANFPDRLRIEAQRGDGGNGRYGSLRTWQINADLLTGGFAMINRLIELCAHNKFMVIIFIGMAVLAGLWSIKNITLDAIPDLSDTQVIIYSRWDRSPDIIEDQVTYPITSALLGVPKVKDIRGFSDFGYSYVYVIFEDGTDIYWARSRTLEYLSNILPKLPQGVNVELARDETAIGWVFQYALVDKTGKNDLAQLRSFQDWHLRYALQAVPGVAEVAPIGGIVRQYQVNLDPNKLVAYNISIDRVIEAVRTGNNDVGGRLLEFSGREYMVRGRGYIKKVSDIEDIVVGTSKSGGTPILVKQLGAVTLGPDIRKVLPISTAKEKWLVALSSCVLERMPSR